MNWKVINIQVEAKALAILGILLGTYFLSKWTGLFVVGAVFCCLGFLLYFRCRKKSYYVITLVIPPGAVDAKQEHHAGNGGHGVGDGQEQNHAQDDAQSGDGLSWSASSA